MIKNYRLNQLDSTLADKTKRFDIEFDNVTSLISLLPADKQDYHRKRIADLKDKFSHEKRESLQGSLNSKKSTIMMVDAHSLLLKTMRKSIVADVLLPYEESIDAAQKDLLNKKEEINTVLTTNLVRKMTLGRKKRHDSKEEIVVE